LVVQHRFPLLLRKLDPETSISTPVPTRLFHRGSDYSHPRNLYSHPRNPYSHPPGIFIHIAPESVSTCPGIRSTAIPSPITSCAMSTAKEENAPVASREIGVSVGQWYFRKGWISQTSTLWRSSLTDPLMIFSKADRTDSSEGLNAYLGPSQSGRKIKRLSTSRTPRTNPARRLRLVCLNH
jgi:hypothetical protein